MAVSILRQHQQHQQQQQQAQECTNCSSSSSWKAKTQKRWQGVRLLVIIILILSSWLSCSSRVGVEANSVHRRFYRRAVQLCSRSLSDALYLLCKDRGYNEPFPNSSETAAAAQGEKGGSQPSSSGTNSNGPGLVEECCYNSCTIEQMEQYCKPLKPSSS